MMDTSKIKYVHDSVFKNISTLPKKKLVKYVEVYLVYVLMPFLTVSMYLFSKHKIISLSYHSQDKFNYIEIQD